MLEAAKRGDPDARVFLLDLGLVRWWRADCGQIIGKEG
jgi:hypothetical protein